MPLRPPSPVQGRHDGSPPVKPLPVPQPARGRPDREARADVGPSDFKPRWHRVADTAAAYTPKGISGASAMISIFVASPNKVLAGVIAGVGIMADVSATWWDRYKQRREKRDASRRAN
jgi:hypothetical protein